MAINNNRFDATVSAWSASWKGGHFIFVEYEGPGDPPNRNQPGWIEAALDAGVSENDLFIVTAATT